MLRIGIHLIEGFLFHLRLEHSVLPSLVCLCCSMLFLHVCVSLLLQDAANSRLNAPASFTEPEQKKDEHYIVSKTLEISFEPLHLKCYDKNEVFPCNHRI